MSENEDELTVERRTVPPTADVGDLVAAILDTVSRARESPPDSLDTRLYDVVDTQALADLCRHSSTDPGLLVHFVFTDCDVLVRSDGTVLSRQRASVASGATCRPDDFDSLVAKLDGE